MTLITLIEARETARLVLKGQSRSYVEAAKQLAEFVMTVPIPIVHAPDCARELWVGVEVGCSCGADDAQAK